MFQKLILRCSKIHVLSKFNEEKLVTEFPLSKSLIERIPGLDQAGCQMK